MTGSRVVALAGALSLMVAASGWTASPRDRPALKGDVEHGRYLVENVAMCGECHSPRDAKGDIIPEQRFRGAPVPVRSPWPNEEWALEAPRNGGLPGYTDELATRLLTQGAIARDGRQLRPPMPRFRMTPQDAADVIAYMRTFE